jgi:two-component sensor histidine kinase
MLLNARQRSQESGCCKTILLAMEDITERKEIKRANKVLLDRNRLMLEEVHHRIRNSMNTLRSLSQLQAGSIQVEKQLDDFRLDARVMQSLGSIVNDY